MGMDNIKEAAETFMESIPDSHHVVIIVFPRTVGGQAHLALSDGCKPCDAASTMQCAINQWLADGDVVMNPVEVN
jgi:hypothetical protein